MLRRVGLAMRQESTPGAPSRDAGNATIELAMVLPLLLLIIAGVIDLGILLWEKQILTNAVREGARAAARASTAGAPNMGQSAVKNIVYNYLYQFTLAKDDGSPLVTQVAGSYTLNAGTCNYNFPTTGLPGAALSVELVNIPVPMMLLPNIQKLFGSGGVGSVIMLGAKSAMFAEWVSPPGP